LTVPPFSGFAANTTPLRLTSSVTNVKITLSAEAIHQEVSVDGDDPSLSTDPSANKDVVAVAGDELCSRNCPSGRKEPAALPHIGYGIIGAQEALKVASILSDRRHCVSILAAAAGDII
jgi:hypothetical protein